MEPYRQRLVREGRGEERGSGRLGRSRQKRTAERVVGGKRDGMKRPVYGAPARIEVGYQRRHVVGFVDVQLGHRRLHRESLGGALGEADAAAEPGENDIGSLFDGNPGRMPRDRVIRQHPRHDETFAF